MSKVEFFTEKDFWDLGLIDIRRNESARRCNEKLNEKLGPVVYGLKNDLNNGWCFDQQGIIAGVTTHKAYLFNIEEIKKAECKHDVVWDSGMNNFFCNKCRAVLVVSGWKEFKP